MRRENWRILICYIFIAQKSLDDIMSIENIPTMYKSNDQGYQINQYLYLKIVIVQIRKESD